ncbi:hypothetical protein NIES4103_11800 [Nostoc sp. NIES-4103]|nr:hypothetical protein NIES4103_11800 [Nostoc sp. NIES-4103]
MLSQILHFGLWTLVWLGSVFPNEAVFSKIFPNNIKTTTIDQQSSEQDLTSNLLQISFDMLNSMKLDDLESIITNEFAQGLPSDTELNNF